MSYIKVGFHFCQWTMERAQIYWLWHKDRHRNPLGTWDYDATQWDIDRRCVLRRTEHATRCSRKSHGRL